VNDPWKNIVGESPLTATLNHLNAARGVARHLVPGQYEIRFAENARSFLQSLPFVYGSQVLYCQISFNSATLTDDEFG
jgi:hypothetical protein